MFLPPRDFKARHLSGFGLCTFRSHINILCALTCTFAISLVSGDFRWGIVLATVNHEYFIVKIFSDSLAYAKIKHTKTYMYAHYNGNVVRGPLSENLFNMKIGHEIYSILVLYVYIIHW